ncbi:MAG: STY0301 family protein [Pseudomonadota bacterium]
MSVLDQPHEAIDPHMQMMGKRMTAVLALSTVVLISDSARASDVCPARSNYPVKYGGPFDGTSEEKASLVPDKAEKRFGYWELAYVYDAGRFVTFRCEYPVS